jgi:hypothetical protein
MESKMDLQNQGAIEDKEVWEQDDKLDDEHGEIPIEDLEFTNVIDFEKTTINDVKDFQCELIKTGLQEK